MLYAIFSRTKKKFKLSFTYVAVNTKLSYIIFHVK
uniref:Uncharacterized protein n=1 Tax=Anguilla anguilla TaxID=7936 RepID=A0A0E9XUJ5_ANGAN